MNHGQYKVGATIKFKTDKPRHSNATPYKRSKYKEDYRDYEDLRSQTSYG